MNYLTDKERREILEISQAITKNHIRIKTINFLLIVSVILAVIISINIFK